MFLGYVNPWFTYRPQAVSARELFTTSPPYVQESVPLLHQGGVGFVVYSHGNNCREKFSGAEGVLFMLRSFDALATEAERQPDTLLVLRRGDLARARRARKLGILLHLTGAPEGGDLAVLRAYFRMGVRAAHPFIHDPAIGGYAGGDPRVGLGRTGRMLLREMERLAMLVDLAHANDRTFWQALRVLRKPVVDSHTCCRALMNVERNRTDDQLRAIASTGGVAGIHFASRFLDPVGLTPTASNRAVWKLYRQKLASFERRYKDPYEYLAHRWNPRAWPRALGGTLEDGSRIRRAPLRRLVDHLEHMVEVMGVDHVGLGSDYDLSDTCEGVLRANQLPNLTAELRRRGFRSVEISKILGENFARVYRESLPA